MAKEIIAPPRLLSGEELLVVLSRDVARASDAEMFSMRTAAAIVCVQDSRAHLVFVTKSAKTSVSRVDALRVAVLCVMAVWGRHKDVCWLRALGRLAFVERCIDYLERPSVVRAARQLIDIMPFGRCWYLVSEHERACLPPACGDVLHMIGCTPRDVPMWLSDGTILFPAQHSGSSSSTQSPNNEDDDDDNDEEQARRVFRGFLDHSRHVDALSDDEYEYDEYEYDEDCQETNCPSNDERHACALVGEAADEYECGTYMHLCGESIPSVRNAPCLVKTAIAYCHEWAVYGLGKKSNDVLRLQELGAATANVARQRDPAASRSKS